MTDKNSDSLKQSQQRLMALSRWDNEGGVSHDGPKNGAASGEIDHAVPELTNAELVHLRIRVIALENLLISMLAGATARQLDLAHEMAGYISPRPGFTQHPLTIHAATQMVDLVERANNFRLPPLAPEPCKRTAVFDNHTLPAGLRKEHRTNKGVWGVIRVLNGRVRYKVLEPESDIILEPGHPGLMLPDQPHVLEPLGPMRMHVEYYDVRPEL